MTAITSPRQCFVRRFYYVVRRNVVEKYFSVDYIEGDSNGVVVVEVSVGVGFHGTGPEDRLHGLSCLFSVLVSEIVRVI